MEQHIKDFEFRMFLDETALDVALWFNLRFPHKDSIYIEQGVG